MEIRTTTTQLANFLQLCIDKKSHINGKLIHAHILRTGLFSDTFLSNRLIELYHKCGHLTSARQVFDKMPNRNIFSWHAMLSAHCKNGDIDSAHQLFVQMPERNAVSWNTLISALVRGGLEQKALNVYYEMNRAGFLPSNYTLASVFSACGALSDWEYGCVCHGLASKIGLDKNVYVGNALLSMYAKCERVESAVKVFDDLPEVNEVSFTAIMGALGDTDRVEEAFGMFRLMHRTGIRIDAISLSSILGVCARSGIHESGSSVNGQQLHGLTIRLGLEEDLHLSNSLLDMYAKCGDTNSTEMIFDNLVDVSVVSWNVMIGGYGQKYEINKAIEFMQKMQRFGFEPDEVTYINMLTACLKSGDIDTAREIFNKMGSPSLSSWNALLSGYSQIGKHKEAVRLFINMQFCNVKGDRTTFAVVFSSCASMGLLEGGKQAHAASVKNLFDDDIYVASGLIGMYSKCNKIEVAKSIFDRVKDQDDIVCWNSMIAGLSLNNLDNEAFVLFKNMLENNMIPTQFSYATVLSSCAKLSSISQGRQIHSRALKDEVINDVIVGSALIDMYCKCGDVNEARLFFDKMPVKNTVTWNEMIHGYAQNGHGNEGVALFEQMVNVSGEKPDAITFIAVLTACSHSGLIDYGMKIFNSMLQEHGVEPLSDHYTCIIDSLGRAGRFNEIEVIIDKMPYLNDPILWEVLLSACRVHLNVSLARRAADELFRINPCNSAPYVLLANMYSSMERWDDVRNIRELMIEKQAVKGPGYSWFEHKDGSYA
ncbi:putative tetratricopeptide-like helical domain superfamily [Helianthus annuus]|nr:putative tetratricopeptide-like helical domain superfamily [Helianthus annuus]KAJ0767068.1 putative tetratricopeptide-like helical domain superfamily [Helianthus annuus]